MLIVSVIGSMAGYAFARRRFQFPLREPLFLLIFLSIMFPPQIMLLSLFQILVQYRLFNSLTGLVLIYVVTELPLTVYLLRTFFAQIPTELEEAARLDGCGDWATFWRVMFPMALPAVATTVILNFIYFWNEFLYAVIFITQQKIRTLPLAIQFLVSDQYQDVGMLATGLMIATLPVLILYLFLSEWFVKGMTAGAIKGYCPTSRLKRSSVFTCSSGPGRPSPMVLTQRCVMPRIPRHAAITFSRSSAGTWARARRPRCRTRRIAARLPDETVDAVYRLLRGGARAEARQRDPAVGETGGAADDHLAVSSHPHGNRPLDGQGPDAGVGHAVPLSRVGHQLPGPEKPHDLELLLHPPAAILEVLAEGLELDGVPAHADAEAQPSAREHIHLGRLLGHERRLTLGQDDDARDQLDAPRDPGTEPKEDERLVEGVLVGVRAVPASRPVGVGAHHAAEGENVRVSHRLDGLGVVADHRGILPDLRLGKDDADLHCSRRHGWQFMDSPRDSAYLRG